LSLELTPNEAKALDLGFHWGQIPRKQIVGIADELILAATGLPSSEICELAVCKFDFQVEKTLSKFLQGADKWTPVILLLKKYRTLSELNEADRRRLYYSISNYADWEDDDPWHEFKIRCHELSDAQIGVYGDEEEISNELFGILSTAVSAK